MDIIYHKKHKAVITGHRGYVGNCLIQQFRAEDIELKPLAQVSEVSTVIHLACRVGNTAANFINNMELDTQLAEFCKSNYAKLVYASGNNVYSNRLNCAISDDYCYHDYYATSKITGELLIKEFFTAPYAILRIGDIFGPAQKYGNFFKAIGNCIQNKESFTLIDAGAKSRNYIYIQDLVALLLFFIQNPQAINNQTYNAAYEEPMSLVQILDFLHEEANLIIDKKLASGAQAADIRTMAFTPIPGFSYQFTMREALKEYCRVIQHHSTQMALS